MVPVCSQLNLGASPNLHSLPPSVSSAAAAPFSKAPTSQSEFGSTAGSASQRQGFAPGFGPANGQAQMQDGQPSQVRTSTCMPECIGGIWACKQAQLSSMS